MALMVYRYLVPRGAGAGAGAGVLCPSMSGTKAGRWDAYALENMRVWALCREEKRGYNYNMLLIQTTQDPTP